ncbi:MAG: hypothetical protein MJ196_03380 [Treponemataceae bacterium]|nr:hypothetical protein [Treponemataceae bacterium]
MRELRIIYDEKLEKNPDLGKRSKFGGEPNWIQNDETPKCDCCKKKMEFVAQLDSIDFTGYVNPNAEYMFGDVGMFYIFFCKKCGISKSVFQE